MGVWLNNMKLFKEIIEEQRERNRTYRLSGWWGLVVKIFILLVVIWIMTNFTKDNIENIIEIFKP